jgi:predicted double-glycine peptidase
MINPQAKTIALPVKFAGSLLVAFMLLLTLVTPGWGCSKQQVNQQDQPVLTSAIGHFIQVPLCRQATDYTCGASVVQSIFYYYGDEWNEASLVEELQSDPERGTNYRNIIKLAQTEGLQAEAQTGMSLDELKSNVRANRLVVVALQAWSEDPSKYSDDWDDGHYAVVVGYDNDRVYFMDPLQLGNYTYILNSDFLVRWHDTDNDNVTKLEHFGVIIWGGEPNYDPSVVVAMQ